MLDAKGAVLYREGVRLSVVAPGFIDPKHYRLLPGATLNISKQIWRLPLNILGNTQNGTPAPRHKTPVGKLPLRPYQCDTIEWIRDTPLGCIAALGTGLGKTIVALHYIATDVAAQNGPFLICGPTNAAGTWVGEHADPWQHYKLNVAPLQTTTPLDYWQKLQEHQKKTGLIHGLFINYEILSDWAGTINDRIKPACIVFDEAHTLRNVKIGARKAAEKISFKNRVHKRIALTATPVVNKLIDIYSLLDLVQPGQWGTWVDFAVRYCNGVQNEYGWDCKGETHIEELQHRFGGALKRVDRFSVGAELPEFTRSRINLLREQLDPQPMLEYDAVLANDLEASLVGGSEPGAVLNALTQALKLISEAKRQAAIEQIERLTGEHYKIAVFTWFKATAQWIAKEMKKRGHLVFGPLTSGTSHKKRIDTVKALEACPVDELKQMDKSAVFVGTLKTTGQAMDQLKCCGAGLVVDLWYVPMVMLQAEGRLHRIGRRGAVDWNYLVADDFSHLQRKANAIAHSLNDSAATSLCETLGGTNEEGDLKALMAALAACPDEEED